MRGKFVLTLLIGLWIGGLVCAAHGYGQGLEAEVSAFNKLVEDKKEEIDGWENQATLLILLIIVVGALGVATGVFQRFKKKWSTIATVLAGALISVITIVNNTMFEVDHRTLMNCAQEARGIIGDISLEIARYQVLDTEEGRLECIEEIRKHLYRINAVSTKIYRMQAALQGTSPFHLHAQRIVREPSWISKPPDDEAFLYFLGVGGDPALKTAKEYSSRDAVDKAVSFFVSHFEKASMDRQKELDVNALSEYLVNSGQTIQTYFTYDRMKRCYLYYTLLSINKRNTQVDLQLYAVQKRSPLPRGLSETLESIQQSSIHYHLFRKSIYDDKKDEQKKGG